MQIRKTIMKTTKFTCLALLILTLPAARGEPFRTDINPALLYYQAFLLAPEPMSDADWDYLGRKPGRNKSSRNDSARFVAGYDNEFKLVREAAQQKVPCDWGIDLSRRSRHACFLIWPAPRRWPRRRSCARCGICSMADQTGARDDLLAAFVLGRNVARDGTADWCAGPIRH